MDIPQFGQAPPSPQVGRALTEDSFEKIVASAVLLRPEEAARLLRCSRARVYQLLNQRAIPFVELGNSRTRRIPLDRLKTWIAENLNH